MTKIDALNARRLYCHALLEAVGIKLWSLSDMAEPGLEENQRKGMREMNATSPCPKDHPLMVAWTKYQETEDFANTKKWLAYPEHVQGSMWGLFMAGFNAATERASALAESVDNASDAERIAGSPGAGAMGAVIEYRDKIREAKT